MGCVKNADGHYLNPCVCRADLLSLGESYISSFLNSGCTSNTVDLQNGFALYDGYCAEAMAPVNGLPTIFATTTQDVIESTITAVMGGSTFVTRTQITVSPAQGKLQPRHLIPANKHSQYSPEHRVNVYGTSESRTESFRQN
jgi:hypothetical protein